MYQGDQALDCDIVLSSTNVLGHIHMYPENHRLDMPKQVSTYAWNLNGLASTPCGRVTPELLSEYGQLGKPTKAGNVSDLLLVYPELANVMFRHKNNLHRQICVCVKDTPGMASYSRQASRLLTCFHLSQTWQWTRLDLWGTKWEHPLIPSSTMRWWECCNRMRPKFLPVSQNFIWQEDLCFDEKLVCLRPLSVVSVSLTLAAHHPGASQHPFHT